MTLATLEEVLAPAADGPYAVGGLVVLGWEDAVAYVRAAQAESLPVILQAGPACRRHTPLAVLGPMFRTLAADVDVPVVSHLDHGKTLRECIEARDAGFSSLMYDGSAKPLQQNIEETAAASELAHEAGLSCEGEIGFVGYVDGAASACTDPVEAAVFARETAIDAMAISVGNVHLQQVKSGSIDRVAVANIEQLTRVPLVIHGGSGIDEQTRQALAQQTRIAKFNIGTELRMAFGSALRQAVARDPMRFDRIEIMQETIDPLERAARTILRNLAPDAPAITVRK